MAEGDIYQLVDKQTLFEQEVLNVYFYRQTAPVLIGNVPQQLADAFDGQVMPDILGIQSVNDVHQELIVTNLFNPAEHYTKLVSEAGAYATGESESTFTAAGFRMVNDNGTIRSGSKRYAGVPEVADVNGVFTDTTFIANLIALGASLILGLDDGLVTNAFLPVIVKRILDAGEYRLPTTSGEAVYGNVTDALYNVNETSQVSRKVGRGA